MPGAHPRRAGTDFPDEPSATDGANPDDAPAPGRYRLRDGVRREGGLLVATRPLVVTRVNDAAARLVDALGTESYQSPVTVGAETGTDPSSVATLFEELHGRGLLEWRPSRDPSVRPSVSVVVTVRDAADHIGACLDAIGALDYPEYEVVVVDDGSTDDTRSIVDDHSCPTRLIEVGQPDAPVGIGASRNRGVEAADNEVVAFTDADCRPHGDWLTELVPALAAHDIVGGRVRPVGESGPSAYEAVNSSLDMGDRPNRVSRNGETPYLPTANLLARRSTFASVGFPERNVAEDVNFCWTALDRGFDVVYDPRGVVNHDYGSGERFGHRRRSYGASEALLATEFPPVGSVPIPVVPTVAGVLFAVLLGVTFGAGPLWSVAALTVGIAVTLAGNAWWTWRRSEGIVSVVGALRSLGRRTLSSAYAVARELTRYYSLPLMAVAGVVAVANPVAGAVLVGVVGIAAIGPAVVEFVVYRPAMGPFGYGWYYLRDHLTYQWGAYRGAVTYRTTSHLHPGRRFHIGR